MDDIDSDRERNVDFNDYQLELKRKLKNATLTSVWILLTLMMSASTSDANIVLSRRDIELSDIARRPTSMRMNDLVHIAYRY